MVHASRGASHEDVADDNPGMRWHGFKWGWQQEEGPGRI